MDPKVHTAVTTIAKSVEIADINRNPVDDGNDKSGTSSIDQLLGKSLAHDLQDVDLTNYGNILVPRLEEFSLRFGNENSGSSYLRMMSIIYRHSRRIARQILRDTFGGRMEESSSNSGMHDSLSAIRNTIASEYDEEEEMISGHKKILDSESYRWLVSVLRRSSLLNGIEPYHMSSYHRFVSQQLRTLTGGNPWAYELATPERQPPLYKVRFNLPWEPLAFLQEQCEEETPGQAVARVVTLTGDGCLVQAETCRGYLEQVWPMTGSEFMNLIVDLVTRPGQSCECVLPDRTEISAILHDKACVVEALGTEGSLGDVAEQLLWISTTLRISSDAATGIILRSARLIPTEILGHEAVGPEQEYNQRCVGKVSFRVVYTADLLRKVDGLPQGDCWMQLFPSCQVTIGYPIPSRKQQCPGLEIPLEIMVSLIGADRVTPFGHDLIIKGYSDLFYATDHNDGCIMWHLICNEPDPVLGMPRISFADVRISQPTDRTPSHLPIDDVLRMRHIVGWTSEIRSNAGAPDAQYSSITSSHLGPPPQGWALDKLQVTAGKYVTISGSFMRSKKQKLIVTEDENYIRRLRDIGRVRFLLCDVVPHVRKIWMVNGLSVLLHLVRSHLVDAENDELYQKAIALKSEDLQVQGGQTGSKAAFETLRCDSNRKLLLHHKGVLSQRSPDDGETKDTDCLEDLVKSLLHILEQIVDHQTDFRYEEASIGYRIKRAPWDRLEGFDFMDVATLTRSIPPRATRLFKDGRAWEELTRALKAPTLFGQCFGEMLEPATISQISGGCSVCHWNDIMPPERDLLAARVQDLLDAGEKDGNRVHFTHGLCLDISPMLFEPCTPGCRDNDRIQKLQQSSKNSHPAEQAETQSISSTGVPSEAAIIFGSPCESYSQKARRFLNLPGGHSIQVSASSSHSNVTTTNNSGSGNSPAQIESTPPTNICSPKLLSNGFGNLCSPELNVPAPQQASQDDIHRRKRAKKRAEEGKYHFQV